LRKKAAGAAFFIGDEQALKQSMPSLLMSLARRSVIILLYKKLIPA
jgi:hypothetical protein